MAMDEAEKQRIREEFESSRNKGAQEQQVAAQQAAGPQVEPLAEGSSIKHVIGVVSGKGGVGKSLVTGILATELARRGAKVGILDADITGPSIPKSFGVDSRLTADADGINPAKSASGIEVMSVNLMLPEGDMPVAWRGPVVTGAIKQFWGQTAWGELDFLLVDMPPGTSDVALTVFQSLPVEGVVIVSSPQDLVQMVVGKAVNMANMMKVPVIGLVENMAYVTCPDCGKKIYPYGPSRLEETARAFGLVELGQLGIDPVLAEACDRGDFEEKLPAGTLPQMTETVVQVAEFTEFLANEGL